MRKSHWTHIFRRGGYTALFHSLSLEVVFLTNEDATKLDILLNQEESEDVFRAEVGNEVFTLLLENGYLVDSQEDELGQLDKKRKKLVSQQQLDLMYLLVADGCNLRCTYCFEDSPPGQFSRGGVMSNDTVEAAIRCFSRLIKKYGTDNPEKIIHLYGGEPLINKRAVRHAVDIVDRFQLEGSLPKETKVVIVTNGVLLDIEMAEFFSAHNVAIGISMDGPKHINNLTRIPKRARVDPFEAAKKAYLVSKKAGAEVGISATLTPDVIDSFDEVLDFFLNELRLESGMSFNILHYNPNSKLTNSYYEDAAKCLIKAFERFRELGVYEERMMRKVTSFVEKEPIFIDCGVGGNQIVIAPDGSIGVCQDFVKPRTYFDGSVFNEDCDPFASGLFDGWKTRSPFYMDQCINCPALAICGGGCPASAELHTGDRWNIDERICAHSKMSLEWLVWQTFSETMNY